MNTTSHIYKIHIQFCSALRFICSSLFLIFCLGLSISPGQGQVDSETVSESEERLERRFDIVANFAHRICNIVPLEGSDESFQMNVVGDAELEKLVQELEETGLHVRKKFLSETYKGVLRADLIDALKLRYGCLETIIMKFETHFISPTVEEITKTPNLNLQETLIEFEKYTTTLQRLIDGLSQSNNTEAINRDKYQIESFIKSEKKAREFYEEIYLQNAKLKSDYFRLISILGVYKTQISQMLQEYDSYNQKVFSEKILFGRDNSWVARDHLRGGANIRLEGFKYPVVLFYGFDGKKIRKLPFEIRGCLSDVVDVVESLLPSDRYRTWYKYRNIDEKWAISELHRMLSDCITRNVTFEIHTFTLQNYQSTIIEADENIFWGLVSLAHQPDTGTVNITGVARLWSRERQWIEKVRHALENLVRSGIDIGYPAGSQLTNTRSQ